MIDQQSGIGVAVGRSTGDNKLYVFNFSDTKVGDAKSGMGIVGTMTLATVGASFLDTDLNIF
ncbi:MAG: hypothetical protein VBE63_00010 [Lamprobacter sp.]|uniref:hypothetical protein n=1 Tax=Lamprobacter sp. TaxID=3100796 RepID=UPI002B25CA8D|nr:hypothetical protein [Lamprobacter sp.]MEA3638309.1 hypothetical protein [Lamprobacter sp.]